MKIRDNISLLLLLAWICGLNGFAQNETESALHNKAGISLIKQKQYSEAIKEFNIAIEKAPANSNDELTARQNIVVVSEIVGKPDDIWNAKRQLHLLQNRMTGQPVPAEFDGATAEEVKLKKLRKEFDALLQNKSAKEFSVNVCNLGKQLITSYENANDDEKVSKTFAEIANALPANDSALMDTYTEWKKWSTARGRKTEADECDKKMLAFVAKAKEQEKLQAVANQKQEAAKKQERIWQAQEDVGERLLNQIVDNAQIMDDWSAETKSIAENAIIQLELAKKLASTPLQKAISAAQILNSQLWNFSGRRDFGEAAVYLVKILELTNELTSMLAKNPELADKRIVTALANSANFLKDKQDVIRIREWELRQADRLNWQSQFKFDQVPKQENHPFGGIRLALVTENKLSLPNRVFNDSCSLAAQLVQSQNYAKAEPLLKRLLAITEWDKGSNKQNSMLAQWYIITLRETGRNAEADEIARKLGALKRTR